MKSRQGFNETNHASTGVSHSAFTLPGERSAVSGGLNGFVAGGGLNNGSGYYLPTTDGHACNPFGVCCERIH
jgi:hypothetical protein